MWSLIVRFLCRLPPDNFVIFVKHVQNIDKLLMRVNIRVVNLFFRATKLVEVLSELHKRCICFPAKGNVFQLDTNNSSVSSHILTRGSK